MDEGRILARATPADLKKAVSADAIVTVSSDGALSQLERLLAEQIRGVHETRRQNGAVVLNVQGHRGILPQVVNTAERGAINVTALSITQPTPHTVLMPLTRMELRASSPAPPSPPSVPPPSR